MDDTNKRLQKAVAAVRRTDIEPYTALRWLGTLFKSAAVFLAIALAGEFVAGLRFEGARALPILLGQLARTAVLAVLLWGTGDLVRLLITVGNDIRAQRILLSRLVYRTPLPKNLENNPLPAAEVAPDVPPSVMNPALQAEDAAA